MNLEQRKKAINAACAEVGCKRSERHEELFVNDRWHAHPSFEFKKWFETNRYCIDSCVSVITAWNAGYFRDLFAEAKTSGWDEFDAEPPKQLTSEQIKVVRDRQLAKFADLKKLISQIGRPMPDPLPTDYDAGTELREA